MAPQSSPGVLGLWSVASGANGAGMPLSAEQAIAELASMPVGRSPRAALEAAIQWRDEVTPRLIEELDLAPLDVQARQGGLPPERVDLLHPMAFYLLGHFREPRAFLPMLEFFAADSELALEVAGDALSSELPALLVRCYDGRSLPRLRLMIETSAFDPLLRYACLQAYHGLALVGQVRRQEVENYVAGLLQAIPADAAYDRWYVWLALAAAELQSEALRPAIEALFDRGLTTAPGDDGFFRIASKEDLPAIYRLRPASIEASILRAEVLDDPVDTVCDWACFQPAAAHRHDWPADPQTADEPGSPVQRVTPKVGRNEPCPCGSGRKHKRCCLQ